MQRGERLVGCLAAVVLLGERTGQGRADFLGGAVGVGEFGGRRIDRRLHLQAGGAPSRAALDGGGGDPITVGGHNGQVRMLRY